MSIMVMLTVAMGKRLIARGLMADKQVRKVMREGRLAIVAGTTNAYVAEEALRAIGDDRAFDKRPYRRGITIAPGARPEAAGGDFDLLIDHGKAYLDRDIFAIAPELGAGDMIMKGANAVNVSLGEAGVLIGHPQGGTLMPIMSAAIGRRVQLLCPVGLEKRVDAPISWLAEACNAPDGSGPRLSPMPARVFTELDAIETLTGAQAQLAAAGGALGAEGCVYLCVSGKDEQLAEVKAIVEEIKGEKATEL